jgi:hypothetical protein
VEKEGMAMNKLAQRKEHDKEGRQYKKKKDETRMKGKRQGYKEELEFPRGAKRNKSLGARTFLGGRIATADLGVIDK